MMNSNKPIAAAAATDCSNCSATAEHKWLLHHVRLRGIYRRLCTSCVLKLHPGSFCPTCFDLFDALPPFHRRVICQKCPSISHPSCIPSSENSKAYTCPPCASPNFSFFDVKKKSEENGDGGGGEVKAIDKQAATVLLCAARIAAVSMSKAMVVARAEAERRVREAALSRKRAREALEHVASVVAKEKARKLKDGLVEGEGSVHVGVKEKARIEGNGGNVAINANRIENKAALDAVADSSCKVSPSLATNGASREKERVQQGVIGMKKEALGSPKNRTTVAVKEEKREKAIDENEIGRANLGTASETERSKNVANSNNHKAEDEKANNGLLPPHPVGGQLQQDKESSYDKKEDTSSK